MLPDLPAPFRWSPLQPQHAQPSPFAIVTMHTSGPKGGGYEHEAAEWLASLREHGYDGQAFVLDAGEAPSWRAACMLKARAVLAIAEAFWRPVLWIDADARVRGPLDVFAGLPELDVDVAIRRFQTSPATDGTRGAWASGTVWFGATLAGRRLIADWAHFSALAARGGGAYGDVDGDQDVIGFLLLDRVRSRQIRCADLAPDLAWMDHDLRLNPGSRPTIEHLQASRRRHYGPPRGGRRCSALA